MPRRFPKSVLAIAGTLGLLGLLYVAKTRPWYFTSQTYLGGLILLELVAAAVWRFRQVFFVFLILAFLLAGVSLPGQAIWTSARWLLLAVGAVVGFFLLIRDRQHHFGAFHAIAFFAVLSAAVSALVSRYQEFALLKALSLFLLFMYAASGARLAVRGKETRFLAGLLVGCEILVGVFAVSYLVLGAQIMGNPNSLGAVAGVVAAPVLLWGMLAEERVSTRHRRLFMYALCMYLVYYSHSRASMLAAAFSCGLLCIGLRKYRTLIAGVGILLILAATAVILQPDRFFAAASTVTSESVYKGPRENGMLASRKSTWQDAVDTIHSHFWFGTGFGTSDKSGDASQHLGTFSSTSAVTTEYGSSYLKIVTWVGMLGLLPFSLLLLMLTGKVFRTMSWMLETGNAPHPAIPVAMVVMAGLTHAAFEDWLFAPGYYLCVFHWCMAFVLVDIAPVRTPMAVRLGRLRSSSLPPRVTDAVAQAR